MKNCFKQLVICITAVVLTGQAALLPLCAEETGAEPAGEPVVGGVAGDLGTKGEDAGAAIVEEAFSGTFAYEGTETDQTVIEAPDGAMASGAEAISGGLFHGGAGKKEQKAVPYMLTTIDDYDTGATLGRCYAPADFYVASAMYAFGDGNNDCSASAPFQLCVCAESPDAHRLFLYKSWMSYLYPTAQYYQEGQLFSGTVEMMLYPMDARGYADRIMLNIAPDSPDITRVYETFATDSEDTYLASQSEYYLTYFNNSNNGINGDVLSDVVTTYADEIYEYTYEGIPYSARLITSTNQLVFGNSDLASVSGYFEWYVPYAYFYSAPSDEFYEHMDEFDLFTSNTRATDEFRMLTTMQAQDLLSIISLGRPAYADLDGEALDILGYDYGTYDTEQFCDYILDQNDYTASDGRSFKVPTSFDYVYEGDDGTIYTTNSTDQPAGSVRLYPN